MEKESRKVQVRSFDDLCNLVDDDNYELLANDVKIWLISYHLALKGLREKYPDDTRGKSNIEIAKGGFTWIDDGKNDVKGFTVESGEHRIGVDFDDK